MASWTATLLRLANNNRRTTLLAAVALWHLVRWRRAREIADEERVARAEARIRDERRRIRDERRRHKDAQRERRRIRDERRRHKDAQRERRRWRGRQTGSYALRESGATKGALGDEKTSGYCWFLTKPLHSFGEGPTTLKQKQRSVRFQLDEAREFYGFAFRCADAVCLAHGTQPEFVGLTLTECLVRTRNDSINGGELHERFCQAAAEGGGWVEYAWRRTAASPLKTKGAWISRVKSRRGDDLYVGVGFAVLPPQKPTEDGLYGFVVNGAGRIVAHGGSRSLVGKTLEDAVRLSDNNAVDGAELLRRIVDAGESGGGWLTYPWRVHASDALQGKGCYIVKIERNGSSATDSGGSGGELSAGELSGGDLSDEGVLRRKLSAGELSGGELSDEGILRRKVGRQAIGGETVLYAGVGYFECDTQHTPPSIPPSPEAARAALDALVEIVGAGDCDVATAVSDSRLGAAAAASTCWSRTALPRELADVLRERAVAHIRDACDDPVLTPSTRHRPLPSVY